MIHQATANAQHNTPTISANQSFTSAMWLKLDWISSITPPKALAPIITGSSPIRAVRDKGNASVPKATKCISLSLPSNAGGGCSKG